MRLPVPAWLLPLIPAAAAAGVFPDFGYTPPADWAPRPTFQLSQNYPATPPVKPALPWEGIDFRQQPEKYLQAVIDYCFEGNIPADFIPQNNTVRKWYHAPWLHYGPNGREFVRGLTGERTSRPYELSATQTATWRNFAVGFYNDLGAYAIGRVWANATAPDPSKAAFPEGSVSFKLLFTTAPAATASWLANSPEWVADIDRSGTAAAVLANKVRLLQIDVAVKDHRAGSGWVFGTFHYDANMPGATPWQKIRGLTLVWGNDPAFTPAMYNSGQRPAESWINAASPLAAYRANPPTGINAPRTFGWAGRGNGPVDNPVSSCLSCHGTAQIPAKSAMIPPATLPDTAKLRWFRNLSPGQAFDPGTQTLDFSLQLGVGIQNLARAGSPGPTSPAGPSAPHLARAVATQGMPARPPPEPAEHIFSRDPE